MRPRNVVVLLTAVMVVALVSRAIVQKERHLAEGRVVFLELAPVDPRSLIQGDYMALRFRLADAAPVSQSSRDGHLIARLDERSVAAFARLDDESPLAEDEVRLRYRIRDGQVKFATNAFFFQEGTADRYTRARYGEFRVDEEGELLLTAMRDANLQMLP